MAEKRIPPSIEKFAELIKPHLNEGKLLSYESEFFTEPGDNYGSTIFKVLAKIQNPNGSVSDLNLVVKMLPETEFMTNVFEPERTFRSELCCYEVLAPELMKLQAEAGIPIEEQSNVFAKFYGGRTSLDENSKKVDTGSVLILENLDLKGYKMPKRFQGFDFETANVILRDLAKFQALCVAFRLKKPEEFQRIRKFFRPFEITHRAPIHMYTSINNDNLSIMKSLPEVDDVLFEKLASAYRMADLHMRNEDFHPVTPFSTIMHNDFWANNVMIRYDENGNPMDTKIVDFQLPQLDSPVHDLIFFIFSSVEAAVIREKVDDFIKGYYDHFISCLKALGCATEEHSYKRFEEEIKLFAPVQFRHATWMLRFIMRKKDTDDLQMHDERAYNRDLIESGYIERLKVVIKGFIEKGFL